MEPIFVVVLAVAAFVSGYCARRPKHKTGGIAPPAPVEKVVTIDFAGRWEDAYEVYNSHTNEAERYTRTAEEALVQANDHPLWRVRAVRLFATDDGLVQVTRGVRHIGRKVTFWEDLK